MSLPCTRCKSSGFLNIEQIPEETLSLLNEKGIIKWIDENFDHDVQVCDCCGDGETWHGVQGEHYNSDDPRGNRGPYAYNGGLCECN